MSAQQAQPLIMDSDARLQIIELLHDITWAQNMGDEDGYRALFTADAVVDYTGPHGDDKMLSTEAAARWLASRNTGRGPTAHRISNVSMRLAGDYVAIRSYFDVSILPRDESEEFKLAYGRYFDEAVATPDGFRLRSRRAECDSRISIKPSLVTLLGLPRSATLQIS